MYLYFCKCVKAHFHGFKPDQGSSDETDTNPIFREVGTLSKKYNNNYKISNLLNDLKFLFKR